MPEEGGLSHYLLITLKWVTHGENNEERMKV